MYVGNLSNIGEAAWQEYIPSCESWRFPFIYLDIFLYEYPRLQLGSHQRSGVNKMLTIILISVEDGSQVAH